MILKWMPITMLSLFSCGKTTPQPPVPPSPAEQAYQEQFNAYWYANDAEISSYDLQQMRYGEVRQGDAVLVFVTEPFSRAKQVKLDNAEEAGSDKISVLKLNQLRKFNTGIYDYSVMTSVFSPVQIAQYPRPLKLTNSIQEWCGQTFMQLNLAKNDYELQSFSYFETEGDKQTSIEATMPEDALFSYIRLNKGQLLEGDINLLPSIFYTRAKHQNLLPRKARIRKDLSKTFTTYTIEYFHFPRTLVVEVEQQFPYQILSWREEEGSGNDKLVTSARLKESMKSPYWKQNSNEYSGLRAELGLSK